MEHNLCRFCVFPGPGCPPGMSPRAGSFPLGTVMATGYLGDVIGDIS